VTVAAQRRGWTGAPRRQLTPPTPPPPSPQPDAVEAIATQVRYIRSRMVHRLMHAELDDTGWWYVTGCGRKLNAADGAIRTTLPPTCDWCRA
jgi:hypothetical protein